MKVMRKAFVTIMLLILALVTAFTFIACSANGGGYSPSDGVSNGGWTGSTGGIVPSAPDGAWDTDYVPSEGCNGVIKPDDIQKPIVKKQLTAAEWRDADNYESWLKLFEKGTAEDEQQGQNELTKNGIFLDYAVATRGLDTFDMHEIYVTCDGSPVAGVQVTLYNENDAVYSAVSNSAGKAYVFGSGTTVEAVSGECRASETIADDGVTTIDLTSYDACENELEIMLVVDTTGSMGDELAFLCDELAGVVKRVSSALDCKIRLGLLFYRDDGDFYVTRKFDFADVTSSEGLEKVENNIKAQTSGGGGDYPEAVDTALSEAVAANWNANSKTKLLFHVLDAPYHDEQENQSKFASAVNSAAQKGIRIIPVAASGLDTLGQYTMRSAALLTGGTYTFLTDDSGIGNSHEKPEVGEYTVEYLSDLMVRLIKGYFTGTFDAPIEWTQSESVA